MRQTISSLGTAAVMIVGLAASHTALAQTQQRGGAGGTGSDYSYWGGRSAAAKQCPTIDWKVKPPPPGGSGPIDGIAYFSDLSGYSKVSGSVAPDGTVNATLTSLSGNGPVGVVTGKYTKAGTNVELKGEGCSQTKFVMKRYLPNVGAGGG